MVESSAPRLRRCGYCLLQVNTGVLCSCFPSFIVWVHSQSWALQTGTRTWCARARTFISFSCSATDESKALSDVQTLHPPLRSPLSLDRELCWWEEPPLVCRLPASAAARSALGFSHRSVRLHIIFIFKCLKAHLMFQGALTDPDIRLAGPDCHRASPGLCGLGLTVSSWQAWPLLVFSLWWLGCCWAATSTWCPSTAPPGSSCHGTGSPTWRTVTVSTARSTVESSATSGTSSASAGPWCGSKCTFATARVLSDLAPPGPRDLFTSGVATPSFCTVIT